MFSNVLLPAQENEDIIEKTIKRNKTNTSTDNDYSIQCSPKKKHTETENKKTEKSEIEKTEKSEIEKTEKSGFERLKFDNQTTFDIKCSESKPWISSIDELPNGNVVLTDFCNCKLYVYNQSLEIYKAIDVSGKPCAIAVINSDKIAVTLQEKKSVALVNILTRKTFRYLNVEDSCHGITYTDDNLVLNCLEKGLTFISLDGAVQNTISDVTGEAYLCSSNNGNIYCAVYWSHKVLCFNRQGDEIYSFSNLTMKCIRGISVDHQGQVFTSEFGKNKIHVINSEGTKSHVILSKKHGINNPLCVHFNRNDMCLYISNNDGESVSMYKLDSSSE
ncbi:unnamed protein product [Mytilus edulis]|uniref:Uncharacterized protein n=1 Tax=Mytilus edulis TaxID=6550 RepID=A0A8S3VEC6_MYTED|nr:unnamed protein product [Mytilus edulis]